MKTVCAQNVGMSSILLPLYFRVGGERFRFLRARVGGWHMRPREGDALGFLSPTLVWFGGGAGFSANWPGNLRELAVEGRTNSASIFDLSPSEKLQLVEDLWDDLAAEPEAVPVHDWQKQELARRKANLLKNQAADRKS